jgi:hypothetical protein
MYNHTTHLLLVQFRNRNFVATGQITIDSLALTNFWTTLPLKMGPIGCPATSVQNYHYTRRKIPEESRSHTANC